MTQDEMKMVAEILVEADTYCTTCAGSLCRNFIKKQPQAKSIVEDVYFKKFDERLTYAKD